MHQALARRVVGVGVVGGLLASAGMGGCVYDPPIKGQREASAAAQGGGKVSIESPFAPVSLRVHPLTHVDAARGGGDGGGAATCLLVLHLETKDAYGDAVKGVGSLRVELAGGGGGVGRVGRVGDAGPRGELGEV